MDRRQVVDWMLSRRTVDPITGCWIWLGALRSGSERSAYGVIQVNNRRIATHRMAAHLWMGFDLNDTKYICHRCDVPLCFNPAHLFVGTQQENVLDAWSKGRGRRQVFCGSTNPNAAITEEQAIKIRELRVSGGSYKSIAAALSTTISVVGKVCRGERWAHIQVPLH